MKRLMIRLGLVICASEQIVCGEDLSHVGTDT